MPELKNLSLCDLSWRLEETTAASAAEAEGSNSSLDRLKADIQLLGWGTAPHSWPGSAPASEVYPQSGLSQHEGMDALT